MQVAARARLHGDDRLGALYVDPGHIHIFDPERTVAVLRPDLAGGP